MTGATPHLTHEVFNQVPPLVRDVADDPPLLEALAREGMTGILAGLHELGVRAGSSRPRNSRAN